MEKLFLISTTHSVSSEALESFCIFFGQQFTVIELISMATSAIFCSVLIQSLMLDGVTSLFVSQIDIKTIISD